MTHVSRSQRGTQRGHVAILALLSASALAGCDQTPSATRTWTPDDHAQPSNTASAGEQMAVAPVDDGLSNAARTALSVYVVACAGCHGGQGHGDGPQRAPVMPLPDFASAAWQASRSDDELVSIISLGSGMMPAFGDRIPSEGLRALVARVRAFGPPPAPQADPHADAEGDAGVPAAGSGPADVEASRGPPSAPEAPPTEASLAPAPSAP